VLNSEDKNICNEDWKCGNWSICEKIELVNLTNENLSLIKNKCSYFNWQNKSCGFQTRDCYDINKCETVIIKPKIIKECYYNENLTCKDNIKNCHDGSCEIDVDCGGPCVPCLENPRITNNFFWVYIMVIIFILFIFIIFIKNKLFSKKSTIKHKNKK
jgi:hypothetical protein